MTKLHFTEHLRIVWLFSNDEQKIVLKLMDNDLIYELHLTHEQLDRLAVATESANKTSYPNISITKNDDSSVAHVFPNESDLPNPKPSKEVIIFLPDENISLFNAEEITNACGEFMEALGFELETQDEPIFSSFWKKLQFVFSKNVTEGELENLFHKGKKALELKHIDLPTAEQTEKLANSAEKIVRSLEKYEEGVVRLGSLLVLKKKINGESKILIQHLSYELMVLFDEKPQLLKNLQTIYEVLTGNVEKDKLIDDIPDSDFPLVK